MTSRYAGDSGQNLDEAAVQSLRNKIHLEIRQMSSNLDKINSFLDSTKTSPSPELILDDLQSTKQKTTKLAASIKDNLKKLSSYNIDDRFQNRQIQSDIKQYTGEFSNILRRFQYLQQMIEDCETKMLRKARSAAQSTNHYDLPTFNDVDDTARLIESNFELEQVSSLEIHQREQSILQIEREIRDINDIFRDLDSLVTQQGEQIESIEDSVMQTTVNVNAGMDHLRRAQGLQTGSRRKRFIFLAVLVVFVVLMILVVVFSNRSSSKKD